MKKYKHLFIDFDGTMFNSYEGCKHAFTYAFNKFDLPIPEQGFYQYIGPTLRDTFAQLMNNEADIMGGVDAYREYYLAKGVKESTPYDGIPELLADLQRYGYDLYVATGKLETVARDAIADFGFAPYFKYVFGANQELVRLEKGDILKYALEATGVNASASLMIGDSMLDVKGANKVGMDCVAVLYGFGDREELLNSSAIACADTVGDLRAYLIKEEK